MCDHNRMTPNDAGDPSHAWKCADCGYVYGAPVQADIEQTHAAVSSYQHVHDLLERHLFGDEPDSRDLRSDEDFGNHAMALPAEEERGEDHAE